MKCHSIVYSKWNPIMIKDEHETPSPRIPFAVAFWRMRLVAEPRAGYHGDVRGHSEEWVSWDRFGGVRLHHRWEAGVRATVCRGTDLLYSRPDGAVCYPAVKQPVTALSYTANVLTYPDWVGYRLARHGSPRVHNIHPILISLMDHIPNTDQPEPYKFRQKD